MGAALDVVQQGFAAFGRQDIPAFLKLVADEIDWKFVCPASWPHSGLRRSPAEVGAFFTDQGGFDDLTVFETERVYRGGRKRYGTGLRRRLCA